jgi:DNA-binding NarL/FixJ family response regulator
MFCLAVRLSVVLSNLNNRGNNPIVSAVLMGKFMTTEVLEKSAALDAIQASIGLLSKSANAQDLCQRFAHSEFMGGNCQGATVFLLNQRSVLVEVASYGRGHTFAEDELNAWANTVLANAIRQKRLAVEKAEEAVLAAIPIQHADLVTGVFMFSLADGSPEPQFSGDLTSMLSALLGMFMENKGLSLRVPTSGANQALNDEPVAMQELTSRQITIIKLIADGMTNAEIAKVVLLSESTVRQETIRIFRTLKCHSRSEAIVKARATGLIAEISET